MILNKHIVFAVVLILLFSSIGVVLFLTRPVDDGVIDDSVVMEEIDGVWQESFSFSEPFFTEAYGLTVVNLNESDFHSSGDGRPVIPVNLTSMTFPFGTKIRSVEYEYSPPQIIDVPTMLSYGSSSVNTKEDKTIYESNSLYPDSIVTYHTGGGLSYGSHQTMLNIRVNPIQYHPSQDQIHFTDHVKVTVFYEEPETPLLQHNDEYDLLIIAPQKFSRGLQRLIDHKETQQIRTTLMETEYIYEAYRGRDEAEKIKYCIKDAIEEYGIKYVLLVGGKDGQTASWNLPARYSHVLIREGTQEHIEPEFLCDLYFADIYDSEGNFSCWDTNNNGVYAEYDKGIIDEMDLYPDVRLGRLPCRNRLQLRRIVNKIIEYESRGRGDWFDNILLVSGDHWPDEHQVNEGVLIMEAAEDIMDDFNPVKLYATEGESMTVRDVNKALSQGAGFAYFCGHGGVSAWGVHLPPDAKGWVPTLTRWMPNSWMLTSFYRNIHMTFLRNRYKLPVTVVGGCFNGKFDATLLNNFATACWAWKLTSLRGGGSIATIANTGLGTHAMDDADNNGINDYLELYDGWLELRFFELYQDEHIRSVGTLHQEAITQYLNRFLGNDDEMDIKMVHQWQLFGDPSLLIN